MAYEYDVYGIGNAIVDTEIHVDDDVLLANHIQKGVMTLVSEQRQQALARRLTRYAKHGAAGGSAANAMVGVAQFGGTDPYRITRKNPGKNVQRSLYRCRVCKKQYTATVGTIFEDSKIPLHKWFAAIYLCARPRRASAPIRYTANSASPTSRPGSSATASVRPCGTSTSTYSPAPSRPTRPTSAGNGVGT